MKVVQNVVMSENFYGQLFTNLTIESRIVFLTSTIGPSRAGAGADSTQFTDTAATRAATVRKVVSHRFIFAFS